MRKHEKVIHLIADLGNGGAERRSNMKFIYYSWKLRIIIYLSKIFSWAANSIVYNSDAGLEYHLSLGFLKTQ